jgi:hypothetical protein
VSELCSESEFMECLVCGAYAHECGTCLGRIGGVVPGPLRGVQTCREPALVSSPVTVDEVTAELDDDDRSAAGPHGHRWRRPLAAAVRADLIDEYVLVAPEGLGGWRHAVLSGGGQTG